MRREDDQGCQQAGGRAGGGLMRFLAAFRGVDVQAVPDGHGGAIVALGGEVGPESGLLPRIAFPVALDRDEVTLLRDELNAILATADQPGSEDGIVGPDVDGGATSETAGPNLG